LPKFCLNKFRTKRNSQNFLGKNFKVNLGCDLGSFENVAPGLGHEDCRLLQLQLAIKWNDINVEDQPAHRVLL